MKQLRLVFACLGLSFMHFSASAQSVTVVPPSNPADSCGAFVYLNNPSGLTSWNWLDANNNIIQSQGDTLYNVCEGDYSISYTSPGGSGTAPFTVNPGPCANSGLTANITTTGSGINNCTGTAAVTVSGGVSPYSYQWYNGATTANISNLCVGTAYVIVTDAQGCTAWGTGQITDSCSGFSAVGISDSMTAGGCSGQISVNINGGTAPYSYSWSTGATTPSLNGLCPGIYTGTVTDANGCSDFIWVEIWDPCMYMSVDVTEDPISAVNACDGGANAVVYGVAGPFTYNWSNGQTTANIANLCPGGYTLTVTSAGGCTDSVYVNISSDPCANFTSFASAYPTTDSLCNGMIYLNSYNAAYEPVTYTLNGQPATLANNYFMDLCSGNYTIITTSANGCIDSNTVTVTDSSSFFPCMGFYGGVSYSYPSSPMACDGSMTANGMGGVTPYSFYWSTQDSTATINGLCQGSYTVTVTDANGCAFDMTIDLYSIDSLFYPLGGYAYTSDETEDGLCDGTATVYGFGGTAPYQIYHSSGATGETATGLCAGVYSATIIDAAGDTVVVSYLVSTPSNVVINEPYPDSTVIDSLFGYLAENCTIDYNSIDSAYIGSANWYTADSLIVTWAIYSSTGVEYITQTYYIGGGNGVYTFALSVYCPQKSTGDFLKVYDQYYVGEALGMPELTEDMLTVFPNPFNESVSIRFEQTGDYSVVLYDMTGKQLLSREIVSDNQLELNNLEMLAKGQYLLRITGNNGSVTQKLVK